MDPPPNPETTDCKPPETNPGQTLNIAATRKGEKLEAYFMVTIVSHMFFFTNPQLTHPLNHNAGISYPPAMRLSHPHKPSTKNFPTIDLVMKNMAARCLCMSFIVFSHRWRKIMGSIEKMYGFSSRRVSVLRPSVVSLTVALGWVV